MPCVVLGTPRDHVALLSAIPSIALSMAGTKATVRRAVAIRRVMSLPPSVRSAVKVPAFHVLAWHAVRVLGSCIFTSSTPQRSFRALRPLIISTIVVLHAIQSERKSADSPTVGASIIARTCFPRCPSLCPRALLRSWTSVCVPTCTCEVTLRSEYS